MYVSHSEDGVSEMMKDEEDDLNRILMQMWA